VKARSGLRLRCAAVAGWYAEISVVRLQAVVGFLAPTVVGELLAKVAATLPVSENTATPDRDNEAVDACESSHANPPPHSSAGLEVSAAESG
jgi:hypothetical protein